MLRDCREVKVSILGLDSFRVLRRTDLEWLVLRRLLILILKRLVEVE